jgi:glyoxylase-like metal-dependent hydrolase (beta-lactamase superfamily II)
MPLSPRWRRSDFNALRNSVARLTDTCCGETSGPSWCFDRNKIARRGLLTCSAAVAGMLPGAARADAYPPLARDIVVQQIPGAPIWYTLGHPGVPSTANEGHTSNAGFVVTDDGVVVFDALGTPSLGRALLRKIGEVTEKPVKYVVLSHYHADHIYGLQAFRDETSATILAQEKALDYTAPGNIDDEAADARLAQRREAVAPWVNAETRIVLPGLVFRVAADLLLGSHRFQFIYAGPAHSMSDMMMLVLPERVLFAGDIVQNGRIPFMASAAVNTRNWQAGLRQVATLEPRFIVPGHGEPSTDAARAIAFTDGYIQFVRKAMGDAVAQWIEFDAAYRATDWSAYEALPAFGASNRGNAYRVFLEIEAESLAAGEAGNAH